MAEACTLPQFTWADVVLRGPSCKFDPVGGTLSIELRQEEAVADTWTRLDGPENRGNPNPNGSFGSEQCGPGWESPRATQAPIRSL